MADEFAAAGTPCHPLGGEEKKEKRVFFNQGTYGGSLVTVSATYSVSSIGLGEFGQVPSTAYQVLSVCWPVRGETDTNERYAIEAQTETRQLSRGLKERQA